MKDYFNKVLGQLSGYKLIKSNKDLSLNDSINTNYGHDKSVILKKPIDKHGNPIPWFTYPAIEFISQFSMKEKMIFEWGSGNSSLFFGERAKRVISIETDKDWYEHVKRQLLDSNYLVISDINKYPQEIRQFNTCFDLIIIDGPRRYDCCCEAINHIERGGIIILDNSDWHPKSCQYLRDSGFIQIDMSGYGPVNSYTWTTSFFFKENHAFPLISGKQPMWSMGGIKSISKGDSPYTQKDHL